jgi:hypothetical protein
MMVRYSRQGRNWLLASAAAVPAAAAVSNGVPAKRKAKLPAASFVVLWHAFLWEMNRLV